jgi:hypothetical protein
VAGDLFAVNTPPTSAVLQTILRREGRSLLQYIREAYPWAKVDEQPILADLQKLIDDESRSTAGLAAFLLRHHINLPYMGAYPDFTCVNYVSLDFLLPRLVNEQRRAVAALEADLALLTEPDARQTVEKILEMKRRHLQKLEELAARQPMPTGS